MKCRDELISALLDGDIVAREAARVRAHIDGCARCRASEATLTKMRGALASLPQPEGPESRDAWLEIARRLPVAERPRRWRRWVLAPAFAVAAALALWVHHRGSGPSDDALIAEAEAEFRGAEQHYLRAIDKLHGVTQHARAGWAEPRRRDFDAALAALESATEQCRQVARARPADAEAEAMLFDAYRKQIRFFEEQLLK
jgi:anti-sigma factor RsiW